MSEYEMTESDELIPDELSEDELLNVRTRHRPLPVVSRISVKNLFGRYSYDLVAPLIDKKASRLMILHGDNGSGKTTVLNLAWNLLSSSEPRGHKSAIAKVPFSEFSIDFVDGRSVVAKRAETLIGTFDLTVSGRPLEKPVTARYVADENLDVFLRDQESTDALRLERLAKTGGIGQQVLFNAGASSADAWDINDEQAPAAGRVKEFLQRLEIEPVLLGDDRELHSDKRDNTRESNRVAVREYRLEQSTPGERVIAELTETIGRVNRMLRSLTINAQRSGSSQEASIYLDVLERIRDGASHPEKGSSVERVERAIDELERQIPRFAEYQLITEFNPQEFRSLVRSVGVDNRAIADAVILPYLDSMSARIDALTDAERVIRLLTTHANYYLRDKCLTYSPQAGLRVRTDEAKPRALIPGKLSSGERQMLLLLCNALLASGDRTLFLIDEPELSLGVPWQRKILSSLLDLTEGTDVQFIVATHSVEMVTANRPSLVKLVNQVG